MSCAIPSDTQGTSRDSPTSPADESVQTDSLHLACSEIAGGYHPVNANVALPGMRGKVFSRPCSGGRGGDVHYVTVCDSGLVCQMLIADVIGHGEAVATVSDKVYSLLRRYLNRLDPRRILAKLNRSLGKEGFTALTTAVSVNYFPPWRRLSVSYAGHPSAWLFRKNLNRWETLETDDPDHPDQCVNLPLAYDIKTTFTRSTVKVDTGDRLLVLTDGALEIPDETGAMLDEKQLKHLLEETNCVDVADSLDAIVSRLVARTTSGKLSHDDVTVMLLEFVPGPKGPVAWHAIKNRLLGSRFFRGKARSKPSH